MNNFQFPIPEGEEDQSQAGVQDQELVEERVQMREEQEMVEELAGVEEKDDEESLHLNISTDKEEGEGQDQADQAIQAIQAASICSANKEHVYPRGWGETAGLAPR